MNPRRVMKKVIIFFIKLNRTFLFLFYQIVLTKFILSVLLRTFYFQNALFRCNLMAKYSYVPLFLRYPPHVTEDPEQKLLLEDDLKQNQQHKKLAMDEKFAILKGAPREEYVWNIGEMILLEIFVRHRML